MLFASVYCDRLVCLVCSVTDKESNRSKEEERVLIGEDKGEDEE